MTHLDKMERSPEFYAKVKNYRRSEAAVIFGKQLHEQHLRLDSKDLSYRIINHWEKNGLLLNARPDGKGWRRYSIIDVIWINIMGALRDFGYSIEALKKLRDFLDRKDWKHQLSAMDLIEYYTAKVLSQKTQTFICVFSDGCLGILNNVEYQDMVGMMSTRNHININLNVIIQKVFEQVDLNPVLEEMLEITPNETYLLANARTGNYEYIDVRITPESGLTYSPQDIRKNFVELIDIINNDKFQEISIKVKGHDAVSI